MARFGWVAAVAFALAGCSRPAAEPAGPAAQARQDPAAQLMALADEYVALQLEYDPTPAYFENLPLQRHDYLPRNAAADLARLRAREDALWQRFGRIDPAGLRAPRAQVVHAQLRELLEAGRGLRVCKQEGWNVNHMFGWQTGFTELAARQPVADAAQREQALARWRTLPAFVDHEIANLRAGLAAGYSAPRSVVARVIRQLDGMLAAPARESPFFAPARNAGDAAFAQAFEQLLAGQVQPALRRYRDFLAGEYRPKARDSLALSALPDGAACYRAMLRSYTTLDRAPEEVYALGERTVAANVAKVQELGQALFGTRDLKTIVERVDRAPDNRFASADEQLQFSRGLLERARERSARYFAQLPQQPAAVEPLKPEQRGTGVSSHYEPQPDERKPGIYRINLDHPEADRRGAAEITLVHETWPGHHLQLALARGLGERHPLSKLAFNSAYAEGWARYAEALSEEAGIYTTPYAPITRRLWPARGMVIDPGIHVYGWTRQQVIDYVVESGRFSAETAADFVDRVAAMPGQLTAYDSGGLEIFALRREAEAALGADFDLRQFHRCVLGDGIVPLRFLRERVERWVAERREARTATTSR
ncbi:DUF885 domain-containing protein [Vulcaniibacterium tengchongense]|uniref:Uncharacterized protein (DUF885 family) n=1 Tax=Vulcaniibacterium tengchongense TaxID=1273429 RepID=A0A3N4V2P5_9GAMM|nr:DUF885 domain-containing protein [Vulcaniibacterium tengchongense]RPE77226.1 uncharacterized protein (DUF885 family) [Vulcaniibacterium tengchongense]